MIRLISASLLTLLITLPALLEPARAASLRVDEDIVYRADGGGTIEIIDGLRVTTLRGNVYVQQGGNELWGDVARLEQDPGSGEILRVVLEGSPARFRRQEAGEEEAIEGHSDRIHYYSETVNDELRTVVEFVGEATFSRGRTAIQCAEIRHYVESGTTDSSGPCSGIVAPRVE